MGRDGGESSATAGFSSTIETPFVYNCWLTVDDDDDDDDDDGEGKKIYQQLNGFKRDGGGSRAVLNAPAGQEKQQAPDKDEDEDLTRRPV